MPSAYRKPRGGLPSIGPYSRVPIEDFIRIWQTSTGLKEVNDRIVEKYGVVYSKESQVSQRAANYRRRGINLKYHEPPWALDEAKAKELARLYANPRPEPLPSEQVSGNGEGVAVASGGTEDSV